HQNLEVGGERATLVGCGLLGRFLDLRVHPHCERDDLTLCHFSHSSRLCAQLQPPSLTSVVQCTGIVLANWQMSSHNAKYSRALQMDTALVTIEQRTALPAELTASLERSKDFERASRAASTLVAYKSDVKIFGDWCLARALTPIPPTPDAICAFISDEAKRGRRPSTIARRLAAIK